MKAVFKLALFLILFSATGCQTTSGVIISDSLVSIKQTRIALTAVLGPHRMISENGRVYTSQYHNSKLEYLEVTNKVNERFYTKATILGARRPYNIAIEVRRERRDPDNKQFIDVGLVESLSVKQAKLLKEALVEGREKDLIIDEGRPF